MNTRPLCPYCDGENIRSRLVQFEWASDGGVIITEGDSARVVAPGGFSISDPIGSIPRFLRIAAGGVIELPTAFDVPAATGGNGLPGISAAVHWLESRTAVAAVALVLVTLLVGLGVWQGAPRLARRIAFAVPVAIEQRAGDAAYQVFRQSFAPTSLKPTEQRHVQAQLDRLMAARAPHVTPRLEFLQMRSPNAFALPGGIIVVADELVELAKTDDELAAVPAHEMGHVERRHGLQSVLRNSAALLVVSTVTGDLSTLGTFSATLPFLLLQYGYAREFEAEADEYAAALLVEAKINPEKPGQGSKRLGGHSEQTDRH